jgi:hypothetical protein
MADQMFRMAGRGDDGTAKALKTDNNGNLNVKLTGNNVPDGQAIPVKQTTSIPTGTNKIGVVDAVVTGSKVEQINFNKSNPAPVYINPATYWEIRDTSVKPIFIQHAEVGIFEQAFALRNTHNAALTLAIKALIDAGDGIKTGATIWTGTIPADARFFFTTDKSSGTVETGNQKIINLVEFRLPYPKFSFDFTAQTAPTSGELMIQSIRRY